MQKSDKDLLDQIDQICNQTDDEVKKEEDPIISDSQTHPTKDLTDEILNISNIQINGKLMTNGCTDAEQTSLFDNIELNEIYQYLNSEDHKHLTTYINKLSEIILEDDQILDYFASTLNTVDCNEE